MRTLIRHRKLFTIAGCVTLLPFLLERLAWLMPNIALVWFLPHQLYYLPLSGLGEPFFIADSDVGFWVQWPGRILTAVVYAGSLVLCAWAHLRWRVRNRL